MPEAWKASLLTRAWGSVEMDEQCLHAFIVARGLLHQGTVGLDGTAPSAIAAVILYDVAVETAAKAALRTRAPASFPGTGYVIREGQRRSQRREHLPWILDQLLAAYRELGPDDQADWPALREAHKLHDYRNNVQHEGWIPSPQDVDRQRFRATDFISSLASGLFGRQLAELSRAMLVQDKEVRDAIEAAEQSLVDGNVASTVRQLSIAFELARFAFRSGQPFDSRKSLDVIQVRGAMRELGRGLQALAPGKRLVVGGLGGLQRILETLVRRSERAEDRLEALSLGAQASDYVWFRNRFPKAYLTLGSDQWRVDLPNSTPLRFTHDEMIRGLDFVTTIALHWQQFPPAPSPEPDGDVSASDA